MMSNFMSLYTVRSEKPNSSASFAAIPKPLRGFIVRPIFKEMKKTVVGHGIGKHSLEEIYDLGLAYINRVDERAFAHP